MRCLVCDEEFVIARTLKNLFSVKKYYICNKCYERYPITISYNHIPLKSHLLDIIFLFKREIKINFEGYILEFSSIYKKIQEINENKLVLFYDKFILTDEKIEEFEQITTLLDKDIVILTNILKV